MKNNIILIGMPWSWKSTLGKRLANETGRKFLDVDDYIENVTKETVWDILKWLWDERFLNYEARLVWDICVSDTVISTSGSVPLRQQAMHHLRQGGISILIDIPVTEIYRRLQRMKVERIVWMNTMTLEEILEVRSLYYKMSADVAFSTDFSKSKEEVYQDFFEFCAMLEEKWIV